jgi:uncharacterized protein (TIGR02996 family)
MSSPELTALLRSVKEQPDDDLPRLVLADWLEEQGELPRAEFVRVQCRLARLPDDHPDVPALARREHELLAAHAARWVGGLKRFTRFSTFERGLLFLDIPSVDAFLHQRGQAERRADAYEWVCGIRFPWVRRSLGRLVKHADAFAGLTHLQIHFRAADEEFAGFIELPQLDLLTHLDLAGCFVGDSGVAALARSPHLSRLTALGLDHNLVSDEGIKELARSPFLGRLKTLTLAGNPVNDRGTDLLARSSCLRSLQSVSLCQQPLEARISPLGAAILTDRFGAGFRSFGLSMPPGLPGSGRRRR